jgi:two-component system sensor histidine kinase UhpB
LSTLPSGFARSDLAAPQANQISMKFKLSAAIQYSKGIKLLLIFIIIILVVTVYLSNQVIKTGNWISNAQQMQRYSKKVLSLALDNESRFRGYILTGQKNLLEPLESSQKEIYSGLSNLKKLTNNNPVQRARTDSLSFFVDTRISFSNHAIVNYDTNGVNSVNKIVETSEGKLYTDRIRLLVDEIQDRETGLLIQHRDANNKSVINLQRVLLLIIAGIVLLLVAFTRKVKADNVEKEKAAAALKKMNDELEQRVIERTQELNIKEKLFRALVENNEGIISLVDEKLNVLFRSASTALITGRQFGENEKIPLAEYLHPDDIKNVKALMADAMANPGRTIPVSIRLRHEDGHYIWLEGVIKNMLHDHAIEGIIANLRDISERKEAEIKIRSAVERYDILSQATSDTIWDWDIVNNTMLYNEGITKTFGYQASEVQNVVDWWNEKLYPDDFKKVTELVEDVFEKGLHKFQLTYRFRCADGSYKYVFDRAYVMFDENNNPCRMIGAMQDISSQVEEEMRVSKAIIDTQEKERQYIGAELHDNVNQVLASSLLVLGMIKNEKMSKKESLEFIETGKGYINNAIEELRKLSHELAPASFDNITLKDAFQSLLQDFNLNNRFKIKFNFDERCNMAGDDIQINLYRIMQEQMKNIVKYAEPKKIEIAVTRVNGSINLRIFDNGKGFDIKTVKNGIGLSNIKKRAESLSGKFMLNSKPGKGCEIIVEIPAEEISMSRTG